MPVIRALYWKLYAGAQACRPIRVALDALWDWTHVRNRFVVVSCERHAGSAAADCLQSVYDQKYPRNRLRHIFIDDASSDGTDAVIRDWLDTHPDHQVEYIRLETSRGGTANTLHALGLAAQDEIVLEVNGDDWLADAHVVRLLNRVFQDPAVWMSYNSFRYADRRPHGLCRRIPDDVIRGNTHREHEEYFGRHLHAFRKRLFEHVDLHYMIDPATGDYWVSADDQALYLCMFELAGEHVRHIAQTLYVYNLRAYSHESWDGGAGRERAARIRAMPRCLPLDRL